MEQPKQRPVTLSDAGIITGACAVAVGIGLLCWQAGIIAAGVVLIALGFVVFD